MPMDRTKYPDDWDAIALAIKEQSGWRCEKCGKQCRFPGEQFDTHRRTLTVAHINHVTMDCNPTNLVALCPACHLAYDEVRKAMQRLARKRIKRDLKNVLFR
ncbi:MAG: HNH endonuclease signature motif containing protein [Pirellula sp.]